MAGFRSWDLGMERWRRGGGRELWNRSGMLIELLEDERVMVSSCHVFFLYHRGGLAAAAMVGGD